MKSATWTLGITSAALFMAALDNLVVTFALPTIQRDFDTTVQGLEWTVNAYTLSFAVLLLVGAALGDRFGRKRVFIAGLGIFTLASIACALAPNIESLVAARAVQGFGGAIIMPLTLTILSAEFPAERRGLALGIWSAVAGVAVALGPVVGGALVTGISWHWIFWLNVPIAIVTIAFAVVKLNESHGPFDRIDLPGLVLAAVGLFGVVFGVIRGSDIGWSETEVVASLAGGAVLVAAFVAWELRTPTPMLPVSHFRNRGFTTANGVSLLMYFGMFGSIFLLSQFLQTAQGYSALGAGVRTLPWTGMPIFISALAGSLAERLGPRPLLVTGMAMQAVALAWMASIVSPTVSYVSLVPPFIIAGIGMSLFFAPAALLVLDAVRPEEEGQASGANNAIRELGGVFGVAVLATVFASSGSFRSPQSFVDGLVPATWVGAAVVAVGAIVALAVPPLRRSAPAGAPPRAESPPTPRTRAGA